MNPFLSNKSLESQVQPEMPLDDALRNFVINQQENFPQRVIMPTAPAAPAPGPSTAGQCKFMGASLAPAATSDMDVDTLTEAVKMMDTSVCRPATALGNQPWSLRAPPVVRNPFTLNRSVFSQVPPNVSLPPIRGHLTVPPPITNTGPMEPAGSNKQDVDMEHETSF